MKNSISIAVIRRLPRYYRFLNGLLLKEVRKISSNELGRAMGITASQIRQDLNCFGGFGQQGYGYNVEFLRDEIAKIIGVQTPIKAVLIGAGNLGRALLSSENFNNKGFDIIGAFDINPNIVGKLACGMEILDDSELESFCAQHNPRMAILATTRPVSSEFIRRLEGVGIEGLWNFAGDLEVVSEKMVVENVHLEDSMMTLRYLMQK